MVENSRRSGTQTSRMKVLAVYPTARFGEWGGTVQVWSGCEAGMLAWCFPYQKSRVWDIAWEEVQKRLLSKLEK